MLGLNGFLLRDTFSELPLVAIDAWQPMAWHGEDTIFLTSHGFEREDNSDSQDWKTQSFLLVVKGHVLPFLTALISYCTFNKKSSKEAHKLHQRLYSVLLNARKIKSNTVLILTFKQAMLYMLAHHFAKKK